ncbi:MAG: type II toxin-antitoxin system Phd/YefM family antitoxin [Clostridia bacterium]
MTNTTITNFRKNVFAYVNQAIAYNSPVNIATKDGNAVVISEDEYNGMLATLELMREPGLVERIMEGRAEPLESCVKYDPSEEW